MDKQQVKLLVIHCTATREGTEVTKGMIEQWHLSPLDLPDGRVLYRGVKYKNRSLLPPDYINGVLVRELKGRGWKKLGYTDLIGLDGNLQRISPNNDDEWQDNWEITNGVAGINFVARHIVYAGGVGKDGRPKDTRTQRQRQTLQNCVHWFLEVNPFAKIAGHNQFVAKACPSFSVEAWCKEIGVPEVNIYHK